MVADSVVDGCLIGAKKRVSNMNDARLIGKWSFVYCRVTMGSTADRAPVFCVRVIQCSRVPSGNEWRVALWCLAGVQGRGGLPSSHNWIGTNVELVGQSRRCGRNRGRRVPAFHPDFDKGTCAVARMYGAV